MALALFSFEAKFAGSSTSAPNEYKIWHCEKSGLRGLYRLTQPVVEDIVTGKMIRPDQRLKVKDINELSNNFIMAKALQAFVHSGTISKVTYEEDRVAEAITDENK